MTSTKPNKLTEETFTVDVNWETQTARVTSTKHKSDFLVGKLRSQMFFQVTADKGLTPKSLSGKYRSIPSAIEAIVDHIKNSKETFAVRSDRLHEERQQRKYAKSESENS